MAIIRTTLDNTSNKDLLKTGGLRKIFDNTVREAQTYSDHCYNMLTTKDEYERDLQMAGLTTAPEIAEGQNIPIQTPVLGVTKTYTQRQWGTGFRMTFKMDFFNKYKLWARWAKDLGKVMKESKDIELAVPWISPTSTSLTCGTGFDSLAIGYTTHTGLNPDSTADNYNNYGNAALSFTALANARYYFKTLVDSLGMHMGASPKQLVIEPTLWVDANEILGSEGKPKEMSNTVNVIRKMGLEIFEYPRLASTTSWFLLAKGEDKYDFNVFTSMEPRFFTKDAPDSTLDKMVISLQMFTYGWGDPRLAYIGKT